MRPLGISSLATLSLTAVLLAGCGDTSPTATDPPEADTSTTTLSPSAPSPTAVPTTTSEPTSDPAPDGDTSPSGEVTILSATSAGGSVSPVAVALKDDTAVQQFTGQFRDAELGDEISTQVARTDVPVGRLLYGAVIAVGCDVPPGVVVGSSDDGVTITAQKVASPMVECFAPMTSVALVLVAD